MASVCHLAITSKKKTQVGHLQNARERGDFVGLGVSEVGWDGL